MRNDTLVFERVRCSYIIGIAIIFLLTTGRDRSKSSDIGCSQMRPASCFGRVLFGGWDAGSTSRVLPGALVTRGAQRPISLATARKSKLPVSAHI